MSSQNELHILEALKEIRDLLKIQNELLEKQQANPSTKITVVGNQTAPNTKGLNTTEDFYL